MSAYTRPEAGALYADRAAYDRAQHHLMVWAWDHVDEDQFAEFTVWYSDTHIGTADSLDDLPGYRESYDRWLEDMRRREDVARREADAEAKRLDDRRHGAARARERRKAFSAAP